MKRLLDDYIFDDTLRYEGHKLIYRDADGMEIVLGGMMGAAVLSALLDNTDEGDARGIAIDSEAQRVEFFNRYEREVRRDNGGLFTTEVEALSAAYIELAGTDALLRICRNDRLFDLAFGLVVEYMHRLVIEQVCPHIYDAVPWRMPFAQWLFDAGYAETMRQHLLTIQWTDPAAVYALAQELNSDQDSDTVEPTFIFEGEKAELLMSDYFRWLWTQVQAQAAMMPDEKVQLAQLKPEVFKQETNWDFIKPELKDLAPEDLNLFRKWMAQWTDFITKQLGAADEPDTKHKKVVNQELFLDNVMSVPEENNYVAVREYILERCLYDKDFHTYYTTRTLTRLCEQLTILFGWYVNPNHLGKRLNSHKRTKNR